MSPFAFNWLRWWRIPEGLVPVAVLPEPPPGQVHLLHHANGRTVAAYDPATGRAQPVLELVEPHFMRDPRVRGRYLPLRSGVLAYYRDQNDQATVQHRRRRVRVLPGATADLWSVLALRTLTIKKAGERLGRLRVIDMPGRWEGPFLLRFFDFTFTEPDNFDLLTAIVRSTRGETTGWI